MPHISYSIGVHAAPVKKLCESHPPPYSPFPSTIAGWLQLSGAYSSIFWPGELAEIAQRASFECKVLYVIHQTMGTGILDCIKTGLYVSQATCHTRVRACVGKNGAKKCGRALLI